MTFKRRPRSRQFSLLQMSYLFFSRKRVSLLVQWLPHIFGALTPILIPPIHIWVLWYFWDSYSMEVDRDICKCSCWDTVYKGPYESGVASYKHMYFNATENMLKIWILIAVAAISLYECVKYFISLLVMNKLRYSMFILFGSSIFAHYYGWWMYINYYNDDFYSQFYHQLFFSITEMICTGMVIHLAHVEHEVTIRKILLIFGISILHILAGGFDQFVSNVIGGKGELHQVIRDIWLMVPDLMHCILPLVLLRQTRRDNFSNKPFYMDRKFRKELIIMTSMVGILFMICTLI